jgi:predicted ArsR family transcriptional regulator
MTIQIKDVNCTTGKEIVRNATTDEIAQIELDAANALAKQAETEAKATARQTILDRLGLTADEAAILLG